MLTFVLSLYLDLFLILAVILGIFIMVVFVAIGDVKKTSLLFRFVLFASIALSCFFLLIFGLALYHVTFETSFFNHIQDGDLLPHLRKGLGL